MTSIAVIPAQAGILSVHRDILCDPANFRDEEMDEKIPCVYILTNKPEGVLYIGVTTCLGVRISQHRQKLVDGFSKKYNLERLIWYEIHGSIDAAIAREKQLKKWNRDWKIQLIESSNPEWKDLYSEII